MQKTNEFLIWPGFLSMVISLVGGTIACETAFAQTSTRMTVLSVSASSYQVGNSPQNTLDLNLGTRWSAEGDGQSITYDLGSLKTIGLVKVATYLGNTRRTIFDIQVSATGSTYSTVLSRVSSSGTTTALENFSFSPVSGRYVRIIGHGNSSSAWTSLTEVEIHPAVAPTSEVLKKAFPVSVQASQSQVGNLPPASTDGNLNTRWSSEGDGQTITYDLGASLPIRAVKLAWYQGNTRKSTFDVQVSSNGSSYSTVLNRVSSSGKTAALENYSLPPTSARYVRIVGYGNTLSNWNSLAEAEIYVSGGTPIRYDRTYILSQMKNVLRYELANIPASNVNRLQEPFWLGGAFYTGVMAAHQKTSDAEYLNASVQFGNLNSWLPGTRPRHADDHVACQTYLDVYFVKKDVRMFEACKTTMDNMIATERQGRLDWSWLDSLFMAPPVLTKLYRATSDPKYLGFLNRMFWDSANFFYDSTNSLYYRDALAMTERTSSGQKVFWSRGNGWMIGGVVRVLQDLPLNDPKRPQYVAVLKAMASALAQRQGTDGLWRSSLNDSAQFPQPETSGTGFFTYALAWGINHGILDRATYLPVVKKGWEGLNWATGSNGKVGWCQGVARAPGPVAAGDERAYCAGTFLLAGSEMLGLGL
ncbi:MAG: glycoside hydrolase family 88 protein [Pseudobdellovibrionaceae bacterium]